jgi:3-deoxy-D-arabino-heptulosonate 7-phosphate (DAHP) synthase
VVQGQGDLRAHGLARRGHNLYETRQAGLGDLGAELPEPVFASTEDDVDGGERGVKGFDPATRNLFDVAAVPACKGLSHLPIIGDSAHGTGKWTLVRPVAKAAVAAGADGIMVEVHPHPSHAFKDGFQSLTLDHFDQLMRELAPVAEAVGRSLPIGSL